MGFPEKTYRLLILAFKTIVTTSLVLFFFGYIILNYEKIQFDHKIEYLNVSMPTSFAHLVEVSQGAAADAKQLQSYVYFYQKLIAMFSPGSDAYGMLGFCNYHLNKKELAVLFYKKAIDLNPKNFWFYYNLGVIYFKEAQYRSAIEVLNKAVRCDPNKALYYINSSKFVYPSILASNYVYKLETSPRIVKAYGDAYRMIVLSYSYLNDFPKMFEFSYKVLKLNIPGKDDFYYYGGIAAYKAGDTNKAIMNLENAIKLNSNFFEAKYYLSMAYAAVGKKNEQMALLTSLRNKDMKGADYLNGRKIYLKVF